MKKLQKVPGQMRLDQLERTCTLYLFTQGIVMECVLCAHSCAGKKAGLAPFPQGPCCLGKKTPAELPAGKLSVMVRGAQGATNKRK